MTTYEYKNHLITTEDDFLWDLLDQRLEDRLDDNVFDAWENS